ncbi:MAG: glycosyltransferase, partial [Candidatus Acidiferrum sp.]
ASSLLAMEAMAAGISVLGTHCIGLGEVLHGSPSLVVPPRDVPALRDGLRELLREPRTAAAKAYAPTARRRFDNRESSRLLIEQFDKLVRYRSAARL